MSQCKLSDFNINLEFVDTSTVTGQYFESQKYITDGPKPYSHYDWSHLILYKGVEVKRSSQTRLDDNKEGIDILS